MGRARCGTWIRWAGWDWLPSRRVTDHRRPTSRNSRWNSKPKCRNWGCERATDPSEGLRERNQSRGGGAPKEGNQAGWEAEPGQGARSPKEAPELVKLRGHSPNYHFCSGMFYRLDQGSAAG